MTNKTASQVHRSNQKSQYRNINQELVTMIEYESAVREFGYVASMTSGENGAQWMSSDGYEFIIWLDDEVDIPEPESELIQIEIVYEDDGRIKFSMTLPY